MHADYGCVDRLHRGIMSGSQRGHDVAPYAPSASIWRLVNGDAIEVQPTFLDEVENVGADSFQTSRSP